MTAFLLGLVAVFAYGAYYCGSSYWHRPIVVCSLVGLVMGDLKTGIMMGATMEVFFLGAVGIGAYIPPNATIGSILGCAFAMNMNLGAEVALTLAMPIAMIFTTFENLMYSLQAVTIKFAYEKYALKGNDKGMSFIFFLNGIMFTIMQFSLVFFPYLIGSDKIVALVDKIPQIVFDGMSVAGGVLPALGLAVMLRTLVKKSLVPYLVLGFALAAYLNMPILGITIFAVVFVFIKMDFKQNKAVMEVGTDEDF